MAQITIQTAFRLGGEHYAVGGNPVEVEDGVATWAIENGYATDGANAPSDKAKPPAPKKAVKPEGK